MSIIWIRQSDYSEEFTVAVSTELDKIGKAERQRFSGSNILNLSPANAAPFSSNSKINILAGMLVL